jgi:hypothetical protein
MGNSEDRRKEQRERLRLLQVWLTSFGEGADKKAKILFLIATAVALIIWGLTLIGVSVNIWLGGSVLAVAFALISWALWIWEGFSRFPIILRALTIILGALIYFGLVGKQMVSQFKSDHATITMSFPTLPIPVPPPEAYRKTPEPRSTLPDLTLRFVYPKSPSLLVVNQSGVLAKDITWMVELWNMELPDRLIPVPIEFAHPAWPTSII